MVAVVDTAHDRGMDAAMHADWCAARSHGGPDAKGFPEFDFSTNSNACGPSPDALRAIQRADATRYPDPVYTDLRQQLAKFHGVAAPQIVLAASGSEFIFRLTQVLGQALAQAEGEAVRVCVPPHGFGDYTAAAVAAGLAISHQPQGAAWVWDCEPSSPLGQSAQWPEWPPALVGKAACASETGQGESAQLPPTVVLDCAYAPLRLSGRDARDADRQAACWRLFSPNKALGLTGVRGAYTVAPAGAGELAAALWEKAPSWPLGAHAVALLQSWVQAPTQAWLAQSLDTLRHWKTLQCNWMQDMGWQCLPSDTPFYVARPPDALGQSLPALLQRLREQGIKLRDTASFGLPGHVRLSVQSPTAQAALRNALMTL